MKRTLLTLSVLLCTLCSMAQSVSVTWSLSDKDNLGTAATTGDLSYVSYAFAKGSNIGQTATMTGSNADSGYETVTYDPSFTTFAPTTRVTGKTSGHCIQLTVTPQMGHTFKPTAISFDAAKVGTDGGNMDVCYQVGTSAERSLASNISPLRNKIASGNTTGYSHFEYSLSNVIAQGEAFSLYLYIYNLNGTDNDNPKAIAFRNVNITGAVDEPLPEVPAKPAATPLKRGLMAVSLSGAGMGTGNLVSWRHREADGTGVKYKLYYGASADPSVKLNGGKYITDKTNFLHSAGTTSHRYKLEVYDQYGNLLETEISEKAWANQAKTLPLATPPVDTRNGATYSPNDASFCDMDGDGEYEIILKWFPSNAKDAASSGTTSNIFFDCYKLDGTRLWRIDMGPNFFASAHTIQFIAWDLDGDGYGEFMAKTGPGTIDGEGKYVIMNNDDPTANWLNSRGKQVEGPEYITVFDGTTGAEISTIPYHTDYAAGSSVWGDSNQNRSERYLAAIAWLDGPNKNPSPIFARGYYAGAFVAAYDFDGTQLTERWVSRNTTKGQGLWGEGAHWISVGDCDGDGKQEIVYGSAALDDDGSLLYRTGLGHGDALHLGDLLPEREGLELFMVHEEKPYGYDLRDAKTGEKLLYKTAGSDTGRGLAAHFDSSSPHSQFIYSAATGVYDCLDGSEIASAWAIGSSGAGINNRVYWDGDLYDEFFDKSIIAHWNPTNKGFDRYKFNNGNYLWGKLNNSSKYNPCILGDILGDWREEIVTWTQDETTGAYSLYICATSYPTNYRIPHLMDDLNYRAQVINQNCCYNQPPHLSYDPAVKYANNPNQAVQEDLDEPEPEPVIVWDEKYKIDFEDGDYSMFKYDNKANVTESIITINGSQAYETYLERTRTMTLDLSKVDLGTYDLYKFEFDWGTGGSNTEPSELTVKADNAAGQLMTIEIPQAGRGASYTVPFVANGETLGTAPMVCTIATPTSLFHIQLVGGSEGVYATVSKDGDVLVDSVKISETPARVTGITERLGRSYNHTVFDNIRFCTYTAPVVAGDMDGSGTLTITDITLLINAYLGIIPDGVDVKKGDMDGDDEISVSDITILIERYLAGAIE